MRLTDWIEQRAGTDARDAASYVVGMTLRAESPCFAPDGTFAEHWLIELIAQSIAAIYSSTREAMGGEAGKPKIGYLVSIDQAIIARGASTLMPGDELTLTSRLLYDLHPIGQYSAEMRHGDEVVATATMKLMTDETKELPSDGL